VRYRAGLATGRAGDIVSTFLHWALPACAALLCLGASGPGVALALADLLDKIGWMAGIDPELMGRVGCEEVLKVALTYLGEQVPS